MLDVDVAVKDPSGRMTYQQQRQTSDEKEFSATMPGEFEVCPLNLIGGITFECCKCHP